MRGATWLVLACAACSVDTRHLDRAVDTAPWSSREGARQVMAAEALPVLPERPDGPVSIDLATVLSLAGSSSLEIELARSSAREAAHTASAQAAKALPSFEPRIGYFNHQGQTQATAGGFLDVDKQNMSGGAGLTLVLNPGEAFFAAEAARRRADTADAIYRASVDATLRRAADAYFGLAVAEARLAISTDDVKAAEELARVERDRFEAGTGLEAAVSRATARVAESQGRLEGARGAVAASSADLVMVLSLEPGTMLVPDLADAVVLLQLVDASDLKPLLDRALVQHPQLAAADSAIAAASIEEDQTRWGWLLPELRAGASFDEFGHDFDRLEARENYSIDLSWQLHFGLPGLHRANKERHSQATLHRGAMRDRIAADVVKARARVLAATARIEADQRAVEAAEKTLDLMRVRHTEGTGLLLEVLDAQAALARSRNGLVTAIADHNRAQYSLLRAVGGPR